MFRITMASGLRNRAKQGTSATLTTKEESSKKSDESPKKAKPYNSFSPYNRFHNVVRNDMLRKLYFARFKKSIPEVNFKVETLEEFYVVIEGECNVKEEDDAHNIAVMIQDLNRPKVQDPPAKKNQPKPKAKTSDLDDVDAAPKDPLVKKTEASFQAYNDFATGSISTQA